MTPYLKQLLSCNRPGISAYAETLRSVSGHLTGKIFKVVSCAIAPIKSLGMMQVDDGVHLSETGAFADYNGFEDRSAAVVLAKQGTLPDGDCYDCVRFSQRKEGDSRLALVKCERIGKYEALYTAPDVASLSVKKSQLHPKAGRVVRFRLFPTGGLCYGVYEDGPITMWLRKFLAMRQVRYNVDDVHILLRSSNFSRSVEEMHRCNAPVANTLFTDGGQLHVASRTTLRWMNESLQKQHGDNFREITMEAFRPNIVIDNPLFPNAEDLIRSVGCLQYGLALKLGFGGMCVRCDTTRVCPATGTLPDGEPLAWLRDNRPPRFDNPNSITFGHNVVLENESRIVRPCIAPGHELHVIEEKTVPQA